MRAILMVAALATLAACEYETNYYGSGDAAGGDAAAPALTPCETDDDCDGGRVCYAGHFCAFTCHDGEGECDDGSECPPFDHGWFYCLPLCDGPGTCDDGLLCTAISGYDYAACADSDFGIMALE